MSCTFNGTTSTFKYGADGLRRQATVNGVTTDYVYDGSTLIREGHASGGTLTTVTATYLTGPRGPEYRRDDTQTEKDSQGRTVSKTRWYVYDGLGSVVGEMDPNGTLTSSPKYDVYGLVRSNSGTASSKMGFVGGLGHLSEANTGLIYMKARYYDPGNGRFANEDPGRNGMNWFVYCNDNPANNVDSNGKTYYPVGTEVSFTLGALLTTAAIAAFYSNNFALSSILAGAALCTMAYSFWAEDFNQEQAFLPTMLGILVGYYPLVDTLIAGSGSACRMGGVAAVAVIACCIEGMELVGGLAAQDADAAN